jgi:uncharacterized membrane protein YkgB
MKKSFFDTIDPKIISFAHAIEIPLTRFALFAVYFWFGFLKIIDISPANPLVAALLERTLPFISFATFIVWFGWYEMLIGVLFLFPKATRVAVALTMIHMITTAGPLVLLPSVTWQGMMVPTLEGQYIIKNLLIIAAIVTLAADVKRKKVQK